MKNMPPLTPLAMEHMPSLTPYSTYSIPPSIFGGPLSIFCTPPSIFGGPSSIIHTPSPKCRGEETLGASKEKILQNYLPPPQNIY